MMVEILEARMRVLLVEDDEMIGAAMVKALADAAYAVEWVRDGATAGLVASTMPFDLILLDLGLARVDGTTVLRQLRSRDSPVPVIVVTARDSLDDRIDNLDAGADDYLQKPFQMGELLARMRAVLRRRLGSANPLMSNGRLTLDPSTREVTDVEGTQLRLTAREFALLRALLSRPGTIFSRHDLEQRVYGWGQEVESNAVEFLIHALRKKLGATAIRNVRGAGWLVDKAWAAPATR
jgi:two-component system OmpR family response regulator